MCLRSFWNKPRIAGSDIPCYKLLAEKGEGVYQTAYMGYAVPTPPCTLKPEKEVDDKMGDAFPSGVKVVEEGYIHSFAEPYYMFRDLYEGFGVVFSAVIPKGAYYYEGWDDQYASTNLYIKEKICDSTNYRHEDTPFCTVAGKHYTVGDVINTIRQCVMFGEDKKKFWWRSWRIALPKKAPKSAVYRYNDLSNAGITVGGLGFNVTYNPTLKSDFKPVTHMIRFSDIRELLMGINIGFADCESIRENVFRFDI